jgi:uncharacterized protein YydD (DUF2326 family)
MLKQLWSPTNLFLQSIAFKPGLNLIVGRYSGPQPDRGINGIGKSSVVRLIDYLLVSDTAEKRFSQPKYNFLREDQHEVCLDLDIAGVSARLRRSFSEPSIVHIARADEGEFAYTRDEAREILGNAFFPQSESRQLPGNRYRSLMQFFIKDDLNNQKRLDPTAFLTHGGANARELTALNLYLLGLPNSALILLNERRDLVETQRRDRETVVKRIEQAAGKSLAELRTEVGMREREVASLREALGDLNLLEDFQRVAQRLGTLDTKIVELRQAIDRGDRQLAKLRQFTQVTKEVDVEDVAEQYLLVSKALGDLVRRSFEDVLAFRESMAAERKRFHGNRFRELDRARKDFLEQLSMLEGQRAALLRALKPSDPAMSLQDAVQRLVERKLEVDRIAQAISDIGEMDVRLTQMEFDADVARRDAMVAVSQVEDQIQSLRELFVEIVEEALSLSDTEREGAFLDISVKPRAKGARPPIEIDVQVPRADALGHARLRLVAYDLTVFLHAVDARIALPRFLVHDGAFHGISRRTVVRALNYIHARAVADASFQYIATFNEDELSVRTPDQGRDGAFDFDVDSATAIELGDTPEEMLFGRAFS